MRSQTWPLSETGSGTVLSLGLVAMVVAMFGLLQIPIGDTLNRAKAQGAAEQAALAGADSLRGLSTGIPCDVARLVLARNGATLVTCRIIENTVYVSARINPFIVAEALAGTNNTF